MIYGRGGRSSEVGKRDQVLEVVGEPVQHVGEGSVVREAFFRIADLENAARRVIPVEVYGQRIVRLLADFMRKRGDILRERADVIDVGGFGVGLRVTDAAL